MKKNFLIGFAVIATALTSACSSENSSDETNDSGNRHMRTLIVTQGPATQTRSILTDQGENGLKATWEMGDAMTVYNKTYPSAGYATIKATTTSKTTNFVGKVDCVANDQLRLFYPEVSKSGSVADATDRGILTLNISNQKGTLEDVQQNYDFNYGEATVSAVTEETATADAGTTQNLAAICKFTFKCDKNYLKGISNVDISGVAPTATFDLSARNTPTLTPAAAGVIRVEAGNADNSVYVVLFPGTTTPQFTITSTDGTYEGALTTANLAAGKFYDVVMETTRTGDAPKPTATDDYVEVCGIKWAKGNLQYDPVNGGDEGFMENWRIAPTQWHWVGYELTAKFDPTGQTAKDCLIKDNFVYGRLRADAYDYTKQYAVKDYNIGKKLFYEKIADGYEADFGTADLGDLAYWASKGKYRMPYASDFTYLVNNASYQFGYVTSPDGIQVKGVLFTTPQGEKTTSTTFVALSNDDLDQGVFFPLASCAVYTYDVNYDSSWGKYTYTKTTVIDPTTNAGYYMSSAPVTNPNPGTADYRYQATGLSLNSTTVKATSFDVYWVNHYGQNANTYRNIHTAYKIRPVLCE